MTVEQHRPALLTWMGAPRRTSGWPAGCLCISWSRWWPRGERGRRRSRRSRCCTPSGRGAAAGRRRTPRRFSSHHASRGDQQLQEEEERRLATSIQREVTTYALERGLEGAAKAPLVLFWYYNWNLIIFFYCAAITGLKRLQYGNLFPLCKSFQRIKWLFVDMPNN